MKLVSLFDGIAGFPLAFQRVGIRAVVGVESEPKVVRIVKARQKDGLLESYPVWKDVRDFPARRYKGADVVTAGFPCQGNSIAGKRGGLQDDRTALWWEVIRILKIIRPQYFLGENVPGLFSVNSGADFLAILRSLDELGFGVAWRLLDARYFGVAQRRERLFIVGYLGAPCPPEILFEPESSEWHFETGREAREGTAGESQGIAQKARNAGPRNMEELAGSIGGGSDGSGRLSDALPNLAYTVKGHGSWKADGGDNLVSGAVSAKWKKGVGGPAGDECYNLVAAPLSAGSAPNSNAAGRRREDDENLVVTPPLAYHENQHGEVAASPLAGSVTGPCGKGQQLVQSVFENHGKDSRFKEVSIVPTINAQAGTGGNNLPLVTHALTGEGHDASEDGTGRGIPLIAQPLRAGQSISDSHGDQGNVVLGAIRTNMHNNSDATQEARQLIRDNMIVRRLSPHECELLMNYPPGWTCICGIGKGRALYGCKCPDSPRYHALGNSVVVSNVEWISRRIATHAKPALAVRRKKTKNRK